MTRMMEMMLLMIIMVMNIMMLVSKLISCISQEVGEKNTETGCSEMMILIENAHGCKQSR